MTSGNDAEKCRETIHTLPLRISKKSIRERKAIKC